MATRANHSELSQPSVDPVSDILKWILLVVAILCFVLLGWATAVTYGQAPPHPKAFTDQFGRVIMIVAVMTRASLGHTGRDLTASPMTTAAYLCVTVGALLRLAASLGFGPYLVILNVAGGFWGTSMLLFVIAYGPILWRPRLGER